MAHATGSSWSRPTKHAITPPPLYMTKDGEDSVQYCKSCGRVMSKPSTAKTAEIKYCSDRCRSRRTNPLDRRIEETFVALLNGADIESLRSASGASETTPSLPGHDLAARKPPLVKGDKRILIKVDEVESLIFGSRFDPEKTHGRKKNRAKRTLSQDGVAAADQDPGWGYVKTDANENKTNDADDTNASEDDSASEAGTDDQNYMSDNSAGGVPLFLPDRSKSAAPAKPINSPPTASSSAKERQDYIDFQAKNFGAGKVRPSQLDTELNFSAMGGERGWAEKLEETDEMREKRLAGERRAREREQVRCAARRLVAFGWPVAVEAEEEEVIGKSKRKNKKGKKGTDDEEEIVEAGKGRGPRMIQKKCEAIMAGVAVEASYAKGPFWIRWREYKTGPLART